MLTNWYEYGSIGANDPDNRKMMQFDDLNVEERVLKKRITELIKTRRNSMALQYGSTEVLQADASVLILKRQYFEEEILITLSSTNNSFTV